MKLIRIFLGNLALYALPITPIAVLASVQAHAMVGTFLEVTPTIIPTVASFTTWRDYRDHSNADPR